MAPTDGPLVAIVDDDELVRLQISWNAATWIGPVQMRPLLILIVNAMLEGA